MPDYESGAFTHDAKGAKIGGYKRDRTATYAVTEHRAEPLHYEA